ncbi:hypothetical protein GCM10009651_36370 [Microbacterium natoriense]|uniref:hypothetical protein n=1 Tax=Microbacterium natoriense TaxID=284570 RepID=UPI0031D0A889
MADDFSELYELVADLSNVPAAANRNVKKAIQFTSVEIKKDWRQGAAVSGSYAETYPASIDFDLKFPGGAIESEIGPSLGKTPGASAGFLEEAPGGVDGPATHAGRDALEANEDDFYRGLEIAIFDALAEEVEG